MNEKKLEQNIQDKILKKIKEGHVHMRPRFYFVSRFIITIIVAVLSLIVSVFVISFIFFSIQESGEQFLLGFGGKGIITFFSLFPWTLLVLDIVFLFLLEWLIRGFKFVYRMSFLSIFIIIFVISTILGIFFNLSPVHGIFLDKADKGELPIIGEIYESIHDSHADKGVFRGTIIDLYDNTIVIQHNDKDRDDDDGTQIVILPPRYPQIKIGDTVYVFGNFVNGVIEAQGIEINSRKARI